MTDTGIPPRDTPKDVLASLNRALLGLKGALTMLLDQSEAAKIREGCDQVLRHTVVAQALKDRYMTAVAGPYGSGKTTLVKAVYELDNRPGRAVTAARLRIPGHREPARARTDASSAVRRCGGPPGDRPAAFGLGRARTHPA